MRKRGKTKSGKPVFDSIRKPTAPPSRKIGSSRREDLLDPTRRKAKHKKKDTGTDPNADLQ